MTQLIITRIDKPYLLLDFIFWRTSYGRRFHEAAQIVHKHAEEASSLLCWRYKSFTKYMYLQANESWFHACVVKQLLGETRRVGNIRWWINYSL